MKIATRRRKARSSVRAGGPLFVIAAACALVFALPLILVKLILSRD